MPPNRAILPRPPNRQLGRDLGQDLLNSQQEGNSRDPFRISPEIRHYNNISGESDIPQKKVRVRIERCKWTPAEDMVLISAWLNTSKDPGVVGNEQQKAAAFWKRIAMYYQKSPAVANLSRREWNTCKQRWQKMNAKVCKFAGCYDHALSQRKSGQSEDDVMQAAYQFYCTNYKATFTLEHAWRELRHNEKWCTLNGGGSSKRTKLNEGGTYSSSSNTKKNPIINLDDVEEQPMAPPPSVKLSSKRQGKNVAAKTTNEEEEREANSLSRLENLWALKEKDIAERKQLSRMEVLKTLLAKTKQLSEKEERLKNKLIDEML